MSVFERIEAAIQQDLVLVPATGTDRMAGRTMRFHAQPSPDSLSPECGNFSADAQAIPKSFARAQDFEACQRCFPDGGRR